MGQLPTCICSWVSFNTNCVILFSKAYQLLQMECDIHFIAANDLKSDIGDIWICSDLHQIVAKLCP